MRRVLLLIFLVLSLLIVYRVVSSSSGSDAKGFVNGKWFTEQHFESATFYAVDGILTKRKPPGTIETERWRCHLEVLLCAREREAFSEDHDPEYSTSQGRWSQACGR
jgi:hypothetical protein